MYKLAALCFKTLKPSLPRQILVDCGFLKRKLLNVKREEIIISFLQTCIEKELFPTFLFSNVPKRHRSKELFSSIHREAIQAEIQKRQQLLRSFQQSYNVEREKYISSTLLIDTIIFHFTNPEVEKLKSKYLNQIAFLNKIKQAFLFKLSLPYKNVINLSNKKLNKSEEKTLSLGMNMGLPPRRFDKISTKIELEVFYNNLSKIQNLSEDNKDRIKTHLKHHYEKIQAIKPAVSKNHIEHINNLKSLRKDKTKYIAKFDKGNGVCVDNRDTYVTKMKRIINDPARFRKLKIDKRVKKDPFIYAEERFNRNLSNLLKSSKISNDIYQSIRSVGSQPARMYGLPKVHKNQTDPKYRPILSMPNSYCTNLAKWLDSLLKKYIPQQFIVNDTFDFINKFREANISSNHFLVSYDVESLFTQIPLEETIKHVCDIVPTSELPINKNTLKVLLSLACKNIIFSFDSELYEQFDGMCMGSNLGPTMAAYAMHMIEIKYTQRPLFYKRYIDDVLAVFNNEDEAKTFFEHINSIHSNIKFTFEAENEGKINFLDVQLLKKDNNIETKWLLKSSNTGTYLHKNAYSPKTHKVAAMRSLINRAFKICSSNDLFEECYKIIENIFINNGYHYLFIQKIRDKVLNNFQIQSHQTHNQKSFFITMQYIKEHEKHNKRMARAVEEIVGDKEVKIQVAYRTNKTQSYFTNKDKISADLQSNIVYIYECDQCSGHKYIGESTRHYKVRKEEHLTGSKGPTEISAHVHQAKEENFSIAARTRHTLIGESIIFHTVPAHLRLNRYHPPFQLQLFGSDIVGKDNDC